MNHLVRPQRGGLIAGVCAGLAIRYNRNVWLIRLLFVLSTVLPGPQIVAYLVLWLVIPREQ